MTSYLTITQLINAGHYKSRRRVMELLASGKLRGHRKYGIWLVEEHSITEHKEQARQQRKELMRKAFLKRMEKYQRGKERGDVRQWVPPPEPPVENGA